MADDAATQETALRKIKRNPSDKIDGEGLRRQSGECGKRRPGTASARQGRRSVRNFSRNRPEATNLNHQNARRRMFMNPILDTEMAPHALINAEAGARV